MNSFIDSQSPSQDRPGLCFSPAPALDLSLSPSSRHTSSLSPSPSSPSSLSPSSPLDSPGSSSSSSPQPHLFSRVSPGASRGERRKVFACLDSTKSSHLNIWFRDFTGNSPVFVNEAALSSSFSPQEPAHPPAVEGRASPQGYQFYLPVGSPPGAYIHSSAFVGQNREKPVSPESSLDGQLTCRWMKVKIRWTHGSCVNCQTGSAAPSSASSLLLSATSSSTHCRSWSTTSMTFTSSLKRILGIVASGRGVHGMGEASTPGMFKAFHLFR